MNQKNLYEKCLFQPIIFGSLFECKHYFVIQFYEIAKNSSETGTFIVDSRQIRLFEMSETVFFISLQKRANASKCSHFRKILQNSMPKCT